jgi:cytochrome c oxidase subunit 2
VRFRLTSPDVVHGFQVVGANVNVLVAPGYVSELMTTFPRAGEYLIVCNEYCGLAHHLMQATIVVEAAR